MKKADFFHISKLVLNKFCLNYLLEKMIKNTCQRPMSTFIVILQMNIELSSIQFSL